MDLNQLLETAKKASTEASLAILSVYNSEEFEVDHKSDDSPLTKADRRSHEVIMEHLKGTGIPILSEEGRNIPFEERKSWSLLWIVDPLDGTKEFIKRNGEFTVNIALVENGKPILGVVQAPVLGKQYFGVVGKGGYMSEGGVLSKLKQKKEIDFSKMGLKVVGSRSHLNNDTETFLNSLNYPEIVSMGSSLKFMMIAEGIADIYPRFAPTMEWDTAAAHAIMSSLGGLVETPEGEPLKYNKEDLLNPYFRVY